MSLAGRERKCLFAYNGREMRIIAAAVLAATVSLAADQPDAFPRPYAKEQGWRPLIAANKLDGWMARGNKPNAWFTAREVALDAADPKRLAVVKAPGPVIVNSPDGKVNDLYTASHFGDLEIYVEWMVPKGSNSGVYLQGLYEIQVFDSYGVANPNESHAGGIYHRWIDNKPRGGSSPKVNASRPPGEWQYFHAWFRAPRFDASGNKTANARFEKVIYNGQLVQENVEVDGPTRAHMDVPEAALNPVMLQGDHGPVAYRNIYVRPLKAP